MTAHKTLENQSGFYLVRVNTLSDSGSVIRTSYEVVDPSGDVIGRFGSLKEAENFMTLLGNLE